jgi:hypothetical protein
MFDFMEQPKKRLTLPVAPVLYGLTVVLGTTIASLILALAATPFVAQPDGPVLLLGWLMSLPVQLVGAAISGYLYPDFGEAAGSIGRRYVTNVGIVLSVTVAIMCFLFTMS